MVPIEKIQARIFRLQGYSGHADTESLVHYILPTKTEHLKNNLSKKKTVFLVHGGIEERHHLKKAIQDRASELHGPESDEPLDLTIELPTRNSSWFNLNTDSWEDTLVR